MNKTSLSETNGPVQTAVDSIENAADSAALAADTPAPGCDTVVAGEVREGIVLVNPAAAYRGQIEPLAGGNPAADGMSWIYLGLALLFCLTGIRFKGSGKYLRAMLSDLTDTRVRHNAFDETVRETSLLVLLNLLWMASTGILLWVLIGRTVGDSPWNSLSIPDRPAPGIGLCMGVMCLYQSVMLLAYWVVGNVFSDRSLTRLWVKGAAASSALETFLLFPLSLLALTYPGWAPVVLIIAAIVFVTGKIVFLYQGFRIFFTQISSWLLFLYYLCSLEIVPLILTYFGAVAVCSSELNPTA